VTAHGKLFTFGQGDDGQLGSGVNKDAYLPHGAFAANASRLMAAASRFINAAFAACLASMPVI